MPPRLKGSAHPPQRPWRILRAGLAASAFSLLSGPAVAQSLPLSFSTPVNVSRTPTFSQSPGLTQDGAGNVAVAWEEIGGWLLPFSLSETGGAAFAEPTLVVPGSWDLSFGQIRMASSGPGDLQMIFTAFNTFTGGAEIVHIASNDAGATFFDPQVISTIDFFNSYVGDVASGWGVASVWANTDLGTESRIDLSVSEDGGRTFTLPKRLDLGSGEVLNPAVAVHGDGEIYAAWVQNEDPLGVTDAFEIYFTRSADRGATFSTPVNLSKNPEKSWPSRIAVDEAGAVYLVWVEGDFGSDMKLLFSLSRDGGAGFSSPRILAGPAPALEGRIVARDDGVVWVAWHEWGSPYDPSTYEAWAIRSLDGGDSFSPPAPMPGLMEIASPTRDRLLVAWQDTVAGEESPEIFVARGEVLLCGDANADGAVSATDALFALQAGVGAAECAACRCDVNGTGGVTATDALLILATAVGQTIALTCPPC